MAEIEPKTREEKLWNGEDIKPLTREEMYIKHIFDKTQTIPDHPITRKEMLMEKAGEGGGGDITIKQLTATENGTYSEEDTAYSPVIVNVPDVPPVLDELTVTENGTYTPPSGTDGYNEVNVSVQPKLETLTAIENDTYTPSSGKDGFSQVVVNVPPTPLDDLSVTENGTYNPTSGHGFDEVTVNVPLPDNAYLLKSDKDDVVSFNDGSDNFFRTLKVYIEPVQDLHGYDKPWVGGAGKNKLPMSVSAIKSYNTSGTWSGNTYTLSGVTFTILTDSDNNVTGIKVNGTNNSESGFDFFFFRGNMSNMVSIGGTYTITDCSVTDGRTHEYKGTFTIDSNWYITDAIIKIWVSRAATFDNEIRHPQLEVGTQATTFAPYSNICPISGWSEANVSDVGKNWLNYDAWKTVSIDGGNAVWENNGVTLTATRNDCYTSFEGFPVNARIPIQEGQTITLSWEETTNKSGTIIIFPNGELHPSRVNTNNNTAKKLSYTAVSGVTFITFRFGVTNNGDTISYKNIQVEYGSDSTSFEPYVKNTITIDLDGTRYGGTLNVVSGVLTVDKVYVVYDGSNDEGWALNPNYNNTFIIVRPSNTLTTYGISNMYKKVNDVSTMVNGDFLLGSNINIKDTEHTTVAEFKEFLASNNAQFILQLATPTTIQLTPTMVKSLLGANRVWADTGETEVEYFAKEVSA